MKNIVTTIVCDMDHTEPVEADLTVTFSISGTATRLPREVDLCHDCVKKLIDPLVIQGRIVKRR